MSRTTDAADSPAGEEDAPVTATVPPSLSPARRMNEHRCIRHRGPRGGLIAVGCSAAGCQWVGASVTDFYRTHLYPMMMTEQYKSEP